MADYNNFPFGDFTVAEIFALARESKDIGDGEFVNACMEAIRLNKCRPTPRPADGATPCDNCGTIGVHDCSEPDEHPAIPPRR